LAALAFIFVPRKSKEKKVDKIIDEIEEIENNIKELEKSKGELDADIEGTNMKIDELNRKKNMKVAEVTEIDKAIEYLKGIGK